MEFSFLLILWGTLNQGSRFNSCLSCEENILTFHSNSSLISTGIVLLSI